MREVIFDTETTGLDPRSGDRMVEIGCVEMINKVATGNTYHAFYNPERDMPAAAQAVHGLSAAFLSEQPRFVDKAQDLLDFLEDSPLVAHNAGFDFGFLNAELTIIAREPVCTSRMIDTVALARKKHPGAKLSLDALCSRYGIDRSHRFKHGALLDAELLAQVYVELTGGRQIGLQLAVAALPADDHAERPIAAALPQNRRPPRPHSASTAELGRHREFLKLITSPLWGQ